MDPVALGVASRTQQHEIFRAVKPLSLCLTRSSHTKMFYVMYRQAPPVSYTSAVLAAVIGSLIDRLSYMFRQLATCQAFEDFYAITVTPHLGTLAPQSFTAVRP